MLLVAQPIVIRGSYDWRHSSILRHCSVYVRGIAVARRAVRGSLLQNEIENPFQHACGKGEGCEQWSQLSNCCCSGTSGRSSRSRVSSDLGWECALDPRYSAADCSNPRRSKTSLSISSTAIQSRRRCRLIETLLESTSKEISSEVTPHLTSIQL